VYSYSIDKTLRPKAEFFCNEVGLTRPELSQVVGLFPPNLWLDTKDLREKIDFLSSCLDLTDDELRGMIVSFPQILGLSVDNNLVPKMNFFLDPATRGLGSNDTSISSSDDDYVHCWLRKNQLKDLVLYQPVGGEGVNFELLSNSPTFECRNPQLPQALLAYSLDKRLKPRVRQLQSANISFFYAPKNLMSYTDLKFNQW